MQFHSTFILFFFLALTCLISETRGNWITDFGSNVMKKVGNAIPDKAKTPLKWLGIGAGVGVGATATHKAIDSIMDDESDATGSARTYRGNYGGIGDGVTEDNTPWVIRNGYVVPANAPPRSHTPTGSRAPSPNAQTSATGRVNDQPNPRPFNPTNSGLGSNERGAQPTFGGQTYPSQPKQPTFGENPSLYPNNNGW
ncbi:MAG: hypothetical protein DHS80DRAFT_30587 [Piptocephalis tieghemiana]|nr:MAG: hypothetical protein DHS80DRAFT_30587 [Piptocephalis tieghemiana]